MGAPQAERELIVTRLNEWVRRIAETLRDEIISGRITGVPDNTTVRRLTEQVELGIGRVNGAINALTNDITGRVRQIYSEGQGRLAAALEVTDSNVDDILPPSQGWEIQDDLRNDLVDALEAADKERRRFGVGSQAERLEEVEMMWIAALRNSCRDCQSLAGRIQTEREWRRSGYWPGNGNTICGERCQCHIAPVSRLQRRFDNISKSELQERFKNGIKLQKKKIEELERLRGKAYSDATVQQLLGQIRSADFNPNFDSRESVFIGRVPKNIPRRFKNSAKNRTFRT